MRLKIIEGLPFIDGVILFHSGKKLKIDNVLIDTGSAGSCFNADDVDKIGIMMNKDSKLHRIFGVGNSDEWVFKAKVDKFEFANTVQDNIDIEIGEMNYGFGISGIIGFDILKRSGLKIDFATMELINL